MSDIKNVVFRSAVGGYNKADVNSYLIKLSEDFARKEKELRERLEAAEKSAPKVEEKLSELTSAFDAERAELIAEIESMKSERTESADDASRRNGELSSRLEEKELEAAGLAAEIKALREENDRLKGMNRQSESKAPPEYEETLKKARMYEKTSANIGDVIISANRTADEIIAAAKENARIIYESSEKAAIERKRELEEISKRILSGIYDKFKSAALENRETIRHVSEFSRTRLEEALSEIGETERLAAERLEDKEKELWQSIRNEINSIKTDGGLEKQ